MEAGNWSPHALVKPDSSEEVPGLRLLGSHVGLWWGVMTVFSGPLVAAGVLAVVFSPVLLQAGVHPDVLPCLVLVLGAPWYLGVLAGASRDALLRDGEVSVGRIFARWSLPAARGSAAFHLSMAAGGAVAAGGSMLPPMDSLVVELLRAVLLVGPLMVGYLLGTMALMDATLGGGGALEALQRTVQLVAAWPGRTEDRPAVVERIPRRLVRLLHGRWVVQALLLPLVWFAAVMVGLLANVIIRSLLSPSVEGLAFLEWAPAFGGSLTFLLSGFLGTQLLTAPMVLDYLRDEFVRSLSSGAAPRALE